VVTDRGKPKYLEKNMYLCQFFYHTYNIECRRIERASLVLLFCIGYLILWEDHENGMLNGIFGHAELKSVKVTDALKTAHCRAS
jgi:hypothetical protein